MIMGLCFAVPTEALMHNCPRVSSAMRTCVACERTPNNIGSFVAACMFCGYPSPDSHDVDDVHTRCKLSPPPPTPRLARFVTGSNAAQVVARAQPIGVKFYLDKRRCSWFWSGSGVVVVLRWLALSMAVSAEHHNVRFGRIRCRRRGC